MKVDLPNTDWIIVAAAMRQGVEEIPDEELRQQADELIDSIIIQADIGNDDLSDLNEFYM